MHRYVVVAGLIFGSCLLCLMWTVAESVHEALREKRRSEREKGPCTFVCQDTDVMLLSVTGTYKPLGDYHLVVTDSAGWPHVIDRRDIVEVIS